MFGMRCAWCWPFIDQPARRMAISISPAPALLSQTASITTGAGDSGGRSLETGASSGVTDKSAAVETESPQREKITLSAANDLAKAGFVPAAPYAEIWKDGRKIAEVDSSGGVNAFSGLVAPQGGGTGLPVAAMRAALIAQRVGGEIRVAGVVTAAPLLVTQARVQAAYGRS